MMWKSRPSTNSIRLMMNTKPQVVERDHDLLAHRAAHDAFQDQEHHVPAVQQRDRQEVDHRQVGAQAA